MSRNFSRGNRHVAQNPFSIALPRHPGMVADQQDLTERHGNGKPHYDGRRSVYGAEWPSVDVYSAQRQVFPTALRMDAYGVEVRDHDLDMGFRSSAQHFYNNKNAVYDLFSGGGRDDLTASQEKRMRTSGSIGGGGKQSVRKEYCKLCEEYFYELSADHQKSTKHMRRLRAGSNATTHSNTKSGGVRNKGLQHKSAQPPPPPPPQPSQDRSIDKEQPSQTVTDGGKETSSIDQKTKQADLCEEVAPEDVVAKSVEQAMEIEAVVIPDYDSSIAFGINKVQPLSGFFCNLCHKFIQSETVMFEDHCKARSHYDKYVESLRAQKRLTTTTTASGPDQLSSLSPSTKVEEASTKEASSQSLPQTPEPKPTASKLSLRLMQRKRAARKL